MDIISFIKPKHEVIFVYDDLPLKEALEKMEQYRFSSIPILNREKKYVGTLTEGDLLWHIKNQENFKLKTAEKTLVSEVHRHRDYQTANIHANIDELIIKASEENFVPIVEDDGRFVGIVTRKTLLTYFFEHNFIVL
jgi:CBS domain-containing protein